MDQFAACSITRNKDGSAFAPGSRCPRKLLIDLSVEQVVDLVATVASIRRPTVLVTVRC